MNGKGRFRFSLRRLLVFMTAVAVLLTIAITLYRGYLADRRPSRFHQAIHSGDFEEVDRLLNLEPRLADDRSHGDFYSSHTPLQKAIVFGPNPKIIDRILEEEPDLDATSDTGETALHLAVEHQKLAHIEKLIRLGANVNAADVDGVTPLHLAAQVDRSGTITKLLLDGGGAPDRLSSGESWLNGTAPLHVAVQSGMGEAVIKHLLAAGADVNLRDMRGRTALHLAVSRDDLDLAKLLIHHGAELTAQDQASRVPGERGDGSNSAVAAVLWWECIVRLHNEGRIEELDAMLDEAPQVLSFRTGYTPSTMLHRAVSDERLDVLDYLLARGMDPDVRGTNGQTPLHGVCWWKPVEFAQLLFDAGAEIEATDENGQTPLHWAAKAHHREMLEFLLAQGADVDARDDDGTTVLDTAFERDFHRSRGLTTLDLLRDAGHKPTVLYAAATGDIALLEALTRDHPEFLDRGYARSGIRPLHAAVLADQPHVVKWLIDQGVDLDAGASRDETAASPVDPPLMTALSYGLTDIAILLIELGADVNVVSVRNGSYAAHCVIAWDRDPKILELLLSRGADPTLRTKHENKTAVELALESKSKSRERFLELLSASENQQAIGRPMIGSR